MIFAAKTTASGLITLLLAFTFNLDQPQWSLLTVFIVAQPQSGLFFAKSFYRIIGPWLVPPSRSLDEPLVRHLQNAAKALVTGFHND